MTPQLIQLKSLPNVALVRMPEIYHDPFMWTPNVIGASFKYQDASNNVTVLTLPEGNWRIIGMLSEVTEEQAGMLVEKVMNDQHHQNYNYKSVAERWVKTALESFHSAIMADGWYIGENPYAKNLKDAVEKSPRSDYETKLSEANIFREAQQRVLDPERTLVIEKI